MKSSRTILYLFESAVGIGHQRRASGIINGLIEAGFHVLVGSGTFVDAESYFDSRAKLIKLPEPRRRKNGTMTYYDQNNVRVTDTEYNFENWKYTRIVAIKHLVETNAFDAVLVEWWPFQRRSDFDSIIDYITETQRIKFGKKPMIISSLRDVIETDNKELLQTNDQKQKSAIEIINSSVDLVLVHGDPNFIPPEQNLNKEGGIKKPVIYTGYVVNELARQSSNQPRNNVVLVSCGSGHEGHYLMNAVLSAMCYCKIINHEWHFVLGPRMQPAEREKFHIEVNEILHQKPESKIVVHNQLAGLPQALSLAALSISLSGYNTTMEVLASGIPSVLIPKFTENFGEITKVEGEQWERLLLIEDRKMAMIAHPKDVLIPEKFAEIIDKAHFTGSFHTNLNMNGIKNTTALIKRLFPVKNEQNVYTKKVFIPKPKRLSAFRVVSAFYKIDLKKISLAQN